MIKFRCRICKDLNSIKMSSPCYHLCVSCYNKGMKPSSSAQKTNVKKKMSECIICKIKGIKEKYPYREGYICNKCRFLKDDKKVSLIGGLSHGQEIHNVRG